MNMISGGIPKMPIYPSRASLFFEQITDLGSQAFAYLDGVAKKSVSTDENEWREFKGAGFITGFLTSLGNQKGKIEADRKIKEIWSESLGAFANSGGGILIWGIK